ncbi:MAG: hypothetical protein Q8O35_00270 [Humidesulfovibrio sp.]|uniref:hypothetical protein n=1 Tax=Humidesulfovibrio sp. TaxID=2910988 RepID=UPI0027323933|nr:hypothetical protein [Humidesulfovibrio sp.]MDP2846604.1 hypothetical protein [Humidesulfovibrio sp.]
MSTEDKVWVGVDPGGKKHFGVAIIGVGRRPLTFCANCADEAVDIVLREASVAPAGLGVDSPLWLSSGPSGDRAADCWVRKERRGNAQAINSLRGAVLVQGLMFVQRMRERFPSVNVTEVHPKALLKDKGEGYWTSFFTEIGTRTPVAVHSDKDHERDALIAAIAARQGFCGHWQHDLALLDPLPGEQTPPERSLRPVHYFWPE